VRQAGQLRATLRAGPDSARTLLKQVSTSRLEAT
jgi:hypothetical protein